MGIKLNQNTIKNKIIIFSLKEVIFVSSAYSLNSWLLDFLNLHLYKFGNLPSKYKGENPDDVLNNIINFQTLALRELYRHEK